jgi:hypothetical protein
MVQSHIRMSHGERKTVDSEHLEYHQENNSLACFQRRDSGEIRVDVDTPQLLFSLAKSHRDDPWELTRYSENNNEQDRAIYRCPAQPKYLDMPLKPLEKFSGMTAIATTITEMQLPNDAFSFVRLGVSQTCRMFGDVVRLRGWWLLDPRCDYALVEAKLENVNDQNDAIAARHITVEYASQADHWVPKNADDEWMGSDGKVRGATTDVIEWCRFESPRQEDFLLAAYDPAHLIRLPQPKQEGSNPMGLFTCLALGASFLTVLLWGGILLQMRRQAKKLAAETL